MRLENTILCSTHFPYQNTHVPYAMLVVLLPGTYPHLEKQESFILAAVKDS